MAIPCQPSYIDSDFNIVAGKIFDIKKYAIHDGPGIRTTIFFKGCPLSCWWCHNPEGISSDTQRLYHKERCIGCRECVDACSENSIEIAAKGLKWNMSECVYCGTCADICPAEAVEIVGKTMTVDEVVAEITKDTVFYDESRGGITVSGGEPLMQPSFLIELLDACKKLGLNFNTSEVAKPTRDFLVSIAGRLEKFGLQVKIGG